MKYAMLIYESPEGFEERHKRFESPYVSAWRTYYDALVAANTYVSGAPLKDIGTATTVRSRNGRHVVQDGPFAEAKEQLGGFIILECPSLDVALEWAARCPAAALGTIEVRPIDTANHELIARD